MSVPGATMSAADPNRHPHKATSSGDGSGQPSTQGGAGERSRKASWRGQAQSQAVVPRYGWQQDKSKDDSKVARKNFWHRTKIFIWSALLVALVGWFIWELFIRAPRTPFVAIAVTKKYPAAVPPNAWAKEDIDTLRTSLGDTLEIKDLSDGWNSRKEGLDQLDQWLDAQGGKARGRWFRKARPVIVYLSMLGAVDEEGEPCLVPPSASLLDSTGWIKVAGLLKDPIRT